MVRDDEEQQQEKQEVNHNGDVDDEISMKRIIKIDFKQKDIKQVIDYQMSFFSDSISAGVVENKQSLINFHDDNQLVEPSSRNYGAETNAIIPSLQNNEQSQQSLSDEVILIKYDNEEGDSQQTISETNNVINSCESLNLDVKTSMEDLISITKSKQIKANNNKPKRTSSCPQKKKKRKTITKTWRKAKKPQASRDNYHRYQELKRARSEAIIAGYKEQYRVVDFVVNSNGNQVSYKVEDLKDGKDGINNPFKRLLNSDSIRRLCPINAIYLLESRVLFHNSLPFDSIMRFEEYLKSIIENK